MATSYEGFYSGGVSSLSPENDNLTGFHTNPSMLGFPGSPSTANQVQDTINAIKHGVKAFEVTMLDPNTSETIPKQHFEEMRALMKLTGVKPSVHAPILDPAGFGEKGWTHDGRADNERRLFGAIEKAQGLDPSGNLPVVLHASNGSPGSEWRPGNEKIGEEKVVRDSATAINQETGQATPIRREFKYYPQYPEFLEKGGVYTEGGVKHIKGRESGKLFDTEGSVDAINSGEWDNKLMEVLQMNKHAEEIMGSSPTELLDYKNAFKVEGKDEVLFRSKDGKGFEGGKFDGEDGRLGAYNKIRDAGMFMENAELAFSGAFNQAYKYGTAEQKKKLKKLSEDYSKKFNEDPSAIPLGNGDVAVNIWGPIKKMQLIKDSVEELRSITRGKAPTLFKLGEDFAMDQAAETFGNLAARSYDKFKEKAPVLAIENLYQGMAFSRAEDMKALVDKSRKNFVGHLVEQGVSEKKAKKLAKDKLGVTWDVGHLNIMKKKGFTDKDVLEQTKMINKDKSMVKHIHLTDNFGYADTHLMPGMGNVPIKGILEELEKNGRFGEMRQIVEAGGMIQHFKLAPHSMTLAAMGSGIYGMKNSPTWGQARLIQGNPSSMYGNLNPQIHHSYFGAGFTTMPVELGGMMPGGDSRFGSTPMA